MQIKSCVFTQKTLYWKAVTEKYLLFWEKYHIEMSALHKKTQLLAFIFECGCKNQTA